MRFVWMVAVLMLLSTSVTAEIQKSALVCRTGMCLYWWPKLPQLKGWHQDQDGSYQIGANVLVPDGKTFANAATVIYAEALYKPRAPELTSVDAMIVSDKKQFLEGKPNTIVVQSSELVTADRKKLKSFTYFPSKQGDWEKVSYGEEGDFYLIFTVSSRTERGYRQAEPIFEKLIGEYREKL